MKISIIVFLMGISIVEAAHADTEKVNSGFFFKPYIGADYDEYHVSYTSGNDGVFSNNLNGGDIHVGARLHKYFGLEASYFSTAHASDSFVVSGTTINTSAKLDGWSADAMGYIPLESLPKLELIGTAGLAHTKVTGTATAFSSVTLTDSETKPRAGIGAQYWLTDNLNARALVRYQWTNMDHILNDTIISTIGLNWQF